MGLNCLQPVLPVLASFVLCDYWRPCVQGDTGVGPGASGGP